MDQLLQHLVNGLLLGATYSLLGIGLTLVFGLMNVVNFAHGEFYTLGAYATGGEALEGKDLKNLGEIEKIIFEPASNGTPIIKHLKYDYVNKKVLVFDVAGTQTADATDLSAYSAGFVAFGK